MSSTSPPLLLRPIAHVDLPRMLMWRNDPRVYKWCRQNDEISWSDHEAWFDKTRLRSDIKMYAIEYDLNMVGVCGLTSIDWVNRRAEFSLYIFPDSWGKGHGEAALRLLLDKAFKVHNLNAVWGESFEDNPATKMFKKIGFQFEGVRREFYYRDGKYIDATLWSILKSEYL